MKPIRIATWNVNGIRAREAQLLEFVQQHQPDLMCLQEIKASPAQVPQALAELTDYWSYWHGSGGYSGVSLHLHRGSFPETPVFSHPAFDMESRIVQVDLGAITVASVYMPNGGKDYPAKLAFVAEMAAYVQALHDAGRMLIICGDMNIARTDMDIHPSQNKPGIIGTRPDERALFDRMIEPNLVDIGRMLDPENDRLYTWWPYWRAARERNLGWRLDYILTSQPVGRFVERCDVFREFGTSDHAPVMATFSGLPET